MEVYTENMENFFLSKENMSIIYKKIISQLELTNINKDDKNNIINNLLKIMKTNVTKLDLNKINKKNMSYLIVQYNNLCSEDLSKFIKNKFTNKDYFTSKHTRNISESKKNNLINNAYSDTTSFSNHNKTNNNTYDLDEMMRLMENKRNKNQVRKIRNDQERQMQEKQMQERQMQERQKQERQMKQRQMKQRQMKQKQLQQKQLQQRQMQQKNNQPMGFDNFMANSSDNLMANSSDNFMLNGSDNFMANDSDNLTMNMTNSDLSINNKLEMLSQERKITNENKRPGTPDFLKPISVGKHTETEKPKTPDILKSINVGNKSTNNIDDNAMGSSSFEPLNSGGDSMVSSFENFNESNNIKGDDIVDDNLSIEQRLQMMMNDRGAMDNSNNVNNNSNNVNNNPNNNVNNNPHNNVNNNPNNNVNNNPNNNVNNNPHENNFSVQQKSRENSNINDEIFNKFNNNVKQFNTMIKELELLKNNNRVSNYLQLEINKNTSDYIYKFREIENIIGIKLISYSLPEPIYNFDNCELLYNFKNNIHRINIDKGYYNLNSIVSKLNNNNNLHFYVNYKKKICITNKSESRGSNELIEINNFQIMDNDLSRKLGFINNMSTDGTLEAMKLIDFRVDSNVKLFLKNINSKTPFGILNFNSTSLCEINFKNPIKLNKLHILFTNIKNNKYDFNGMMYNLSFQLIIRN